jgi:hypothetical protein
MNLKVNDAQNCLYHIMGYMFSGDSPRVFADIWMSKLAKENAAESSDNSAARVSLDSGTDPITKILGQKKQKVAAENSEAAPTQGGRAGLKVPASVPGSPPRVTTASAAPTQGPRAGSKEPGPGSPPRVASAAAPAVATSPAGGRPSSAHGSPARRRTAAGISQSPAAKANVSSTD